MSDWLPYLASTFWVFTVSFFPVGGMYIAIPMGLLLGLDSFSVFLFATLGSFIPLIIVSYFYGILIQFDWFRRLVAYLEKPKIKAWLDRWSRWVVLASLPFFNGWIVGIFARSAGLSPRDYLPLSFFAIAFLAALQVFLIDLGKHLATHWLF